MSLEMKIREAAGHIASQDLDGLLHTEMGNQGFQEHRALVESIRAFATEVAVVDWGHFEGEAIRDARDRMQHLESAVHNLKEFRPQTGSRDTIIVDLRTTYAYAVAACGPILAYVRRDTTFAHTAIKEITAAKEQSGRLLEEAQRFCSEKRGVIEEAERIAKSLASQKAVAVFGREFEGLARRYLWSGVLWLVGTLIVALGTLTLLLRPDVWPGLGLPPAPTAPGAPLVPWVASRVVFLTIASFLLVWCSRNYHASQHLAVTNRHRHSALKTFEAFVTAGTTPATRDAVLLQVAHAIFAPERSGHLGHRHESPVAVAVEAAKVAKP